ncbi:HNH endonuclease signature motif containing protein [Entomomonas asaccharolytica]|uniref:HNH endonuclease n=1 Tax=Entomomonas asaccharolytica TaxID=2785331 RepID=A0A974RYY8_9GAMM|nr:HNH endonuclease signature motif containing protein [Entomomonas asaccharolytica]QQP86464.1 HNH endonuclease [Entomomonas asaccharolytica]
MEKYWIVALGETYHIATSEGFLWSPKLTKAGRRNVGYENMNVAQVGDIVFTCVDQHIKDIGIVIQSSYSRVAPEYSTFNNWANMDGHALRIDWFHPKQDIFLKNYIDLINKINSSPSPFVKQKNKSELSTIGLKQQYLIEISKEYANFFFEKLSIENKVNDIKLELDKLLVQEIVEKDTSAIPVNTTKKALVDIRTAQLKFTENLLKIEKVCRVTNTLYDFDKIKDRYLIASHIKRWVDCTREERVDGNNGLLLAPHIDYLFDRYLISFQKDGTMLISEIVKKDAIFEKWNIIEKNVGCFSDKQDFYLKDHRDKFFKKQKES